MRNPFLLRKHTSSLARVTLGPMTPTRHARWIQETRPRCRRWMARLRRMQEGVYESVLTSGLLSQADAVTDLEAEIARVDPADQTHVLARHLASAIQSRLAAERDPDQADPGQLTSANHPSRRTSVEHPVRELHGLRRPPAPGRTVRYASATEDPPERRGAPDQRARRAQSWRRSSAEIESADRVDLLCAFVMWHGLRAARRRRCASARRGVPFRVVTTTYIGAHRAPGTRPSGA